MAGLKERLNGALDSLRKVKPETYDPTAPIKKAAQSVSSAAMTGYSTAKADLKALTRKDMPASNAGETLYKEANRRAKKLLGE